MRTCHVHFMEKTWEDGGRHVKCGDPAHDVEFSNDWSKVNCRGCLRSLKKITNETKMQALKEEIKNLEQENENLKSALKFYKSTEFREMLEKICALVEEKIKPSST